MNAEMWKAFGSMRVKALVGLCCTIYTTGVWPEDRMRTVLVHFEIRSQTTRCDEHRTIIPVVHA